MKSTFHLAAEIWLTYTGNAGVKSWMTSRMALLQLWPTFEADLRGLAVKVFQRKLWHPVGNNRSLRSRLGKTPTRQIIG